jgi:hypothetical protein
MEAEMSNDTQAVQVRTDFYTMVHKALRKRLFEAVLLAGTTDYGDADDRAKLREHAAHEDQFLHPIIAEVLPEMARSRHAEHQDHHRALDEVERAFEVAAAERTGASGHRAYRTLARMAGHFLAHIEEEEASQPRLWEMAGEARLAAGMDAFKRSRTLDQTRAGWANMLPAMNPAERTAMFQGLRSGAPEGIVAAAYQVAEKVLDDRAWQALASSLPSDSGLYRMARTTPPSTRKADPVVAEARPLHT